jgi:hypothetical protein
MRKRVALQTRSGVSARPNGPNTEIFVLAVDCSAKFRCLQRCSGRTRVASDMVLAFDTIFSFNIILRVNIMECRHPVCAGLSSRSILSWRPRCCCDSLKGHCSLLCDLNRMHFALRTFAFPASARALQSTLGMGTELPHRETHHGLVTEFSKDARSFNSMQQSRYHIAFFSACSVHTHTFDNNSSPHHL